jgi:hypothetical protein
LAGGLVVTSETVNTGFDENQTVLGALVLAVAFHMLADGHSLLDQVVQIFRDFGGETTGLEDTEDLVASNTLDLRDAMRITEDDTNLSGGKTLLGVLADHINNFFGGSLDPRRRSAAIREGTARDTFTGSVLT